MFKHIDVRSGFNYDTDEASEESGLMCLDESLTQQQFAEESDINTIVKRFGLTGELPEVVRLPVSGDFTGVVDFQTAMTAVRVAQESFNELPAHIRYRFANDPQKLMDFIEDDDNRMEADKMGLLQKPPEVTRDVVTAVDELKDWFKNTQPVDKK